MYEYKNKASLVLATQGLTRRFNILVQCLESIFDLIPPNDKAPAPMEIMNATIFLQAFIINVFGTMDNFARLWVAEAGLSKNNGEDIPNTWIGLGPKQTFIRQSLSQSFQDYLAETEGWFKYLENYRHALAHRIPLYIPPKTMDNEGAEQFQMLEYEKTAALEARNFDRFRDLLGEQTSLGEFEPVMMHSYGSTEEDGRPVWFHGQMICDLATLVEIGEKLIFELEGLPPE